MPILINGISRAINQVANDFDNEIERELRERSLMATADVKLATPVDTGRARNSWHIGYQSDLFDRTFDQLVSLTPSREPRTIYVTNGTTYIQHLNNGSSVQAPSRFIENSFLRYFDDVQVEVIDN